MLEIIMWLILIGTALAFLVTLVLDFIFVLITVPRMDVKTPKRKYLTPVADNVNKTFDGE